MTGQIIAALLFLGVVVGVPLLLVLWARRARMYSGRAFRYDGPHPGPASSGHVGRGADRSPEVYAPATPEDGGRVGEGSSLSSAEREQWEQLVSVAWELPSRRDERA